MRAKNSIKNIITGVSLQVITILLGFISRKVFVQYLGLELLGINGLLLNVVSMLSLVELGIGSAIYYSLYKPLADDNKKQVHAIMDLYSRLYKYIGILVAIVGICIIPFLKYFVETDISMGYVKIVFGVFLIDATLSYFLAYRRNILSADQKNYVINKLTTVFNVVLTTLQIVIIIITKNYLLFLGVKVILVVIQNLVIYYKTNREYPYIKGKPAEALDGNIKKEIIKNAKALFIVNIAVYCVFGTDNILLSYFAGVTVVGLYSNYFLLINTVNGIIVQVFNGIKASFGNFLVEQSMDKAHELFNVLYFVNFWITSFCAIALVTLLNPFIEIWLGKDMLFGSAVVVIIVFNFYSKSMTSAIDTARNAAGLYSPYPFFKYWALVEGIVNLTVSIFLAGPMKLGMYGIFLGTAVSTCISVYVLPWNVYKYVFNRSSMGYYIKHFLFMVITITIAALINLFGNIVIAQNIYIQFAYKLMLCAVIPNIVIVLLFYKSKEFKYLYGKLDLSKIINKFKRVKDKSNIV